MSDNVSGPNDQPNFTPPPAPPPAPAVPVQNERVVLGISWAFLAILAGVVLTVLIWRAGYVASISSFLMAAGAVFLYTKTAGSPPRKGLVPLIVLIVVGIVVCFFSIVVSDLWDIYDDFRMPGSRSSFIVDNMFKGSVLKEYGKDMALFGVFAVLGIFSTLRRVLATR
jgi:hypothetical protein